MTTAILSAIRGTDWNLTLPLLGNLTARTKLYLTARSRLPAPDRRSMIQVEETTGLIYINGHATDEQVLGALVVDNPTTGLVRLVLDASMSTLLPSGIYNFDVKMITLSSVDLLLDPASVIEVRDPVTQTIA